MSLTVLEALSLDGLKDARLVGGRTGLDRVIRHVSVIEVPDADVWFGGDEFWLTALYAYRDDVKNQIALIRKLDECGAAALAVFYPTRYSSGLPQEVVDVADEVGLPLLVLPDHVRYRDVIFALYQEIVDRQSMYLERALLFQEELNKLLLRNEDLPALARKVADLFGHPIVVLGRDFQVQACGLPEASGHSNAESLKELLGAGIFPDWSKAFANKIPAGGTAEIDVEFPEFGALVKTMARAVSSGANVGGYLAVVSAGESLGLEVSLCLERAGSAVALHLAKDRAVHEAELRLQREFIDELLSGLLHTREDILARARVFGWDLGHRGAAVVVETAPSDSAVHEALRRLTRQDNPAHISFHWRGQTVVIPDLGFPTATQAEGHSRVARLARVLAEHLTAMPRLVFAIGAGRLYGDALNLHQSYSEARGAAEVGRKIFGPGHTVWAQDIGAHLLLGLLRDSIQAVALVDQLLDPLIAYDRKNRTDLCGTLCACLFRHGDAVDVCERLHIHRNTLRYRKEKIRTILGLDPFSEPHHFSHMVAVSLYLLRNGGHYAGS